MGVRLLSQLTLAVLSLFVINIAVNSSSHAMNDEWISADVNVKQADQSKIRPCENKTIQLVIYSGDRYGELTNTTGCIYEGKDYKLARLADYPYAYSWAIELNHSEKFVYLNHFTPSTKIILTKWSNRLAYISYSNGKPVETALISIDDVTDSIQVNESNLIQPIKYQFKESNQKVWYMHTDLSTGFKDHLDVYSAAMSPNGRYLLTWVGNVGHGVIDLVESTVKVVTSQEGHPNTSPYSPDINTNPTAGAISNDGKFAFINTGPRLIKISSSCGTTYRGNQDMHIDYFTQLENECPVDEYDLGALTGFSGYQTNYRWIIEDQSLEFYHFDFNASSGNKKLITITRSADKDIGMNYLALGDSFTSGEGDTDSLADGSSFYLPGTEQSGGCHVSSRSYPFVLAGLRESSADKVKNVACSGAQLAKDYYGDSTQYNGQSDRIKDKSEVEKTEIRQAALESFLPGVLKQIDFVRKAQPKYVTITGGGNDAGFGPILKECAQSVGVTCSYATRGSDMMVVLGKSIQQQFSSMQNVIAAVKEASPNTVVYVVGYPSFVASEARSCGGRAGALNQRERTVINSGVAYLNDVLKAAAESKGVHYVDIENSLAGGRLCEQQAYVTSVIDAFFDEDMRQAFHPNATGHQKMAESLLELNVLGESENPAALQAVAPGVPAEFGNSGDVKVQRMTNIVKELLKIRNKTMFKVDKGMFKAFTKVSISIHSKIKKLGEYKVAADGSLSAERNLPNDIPTGYHTVLLKGVAADGAPLWLVQSVYVEGEEPDVDKDGVPNGNDKCQFRPQRFDEDNQRFVCADKPRNHHKKEDKR